MKEGVKLVLPHRGIGKDLVEMLRKELQIPDQATWFEVRFAVDEPVTVKVEYHPRQLDADESAAARGDAS